MAMAHSRSVGSRERREEEEEEGKGGIIAPRFGFSLLWVRGGVFQSWI